MTTDDEQASSDSRIIDDEQRRAERGRPAWLFIAPFGIFFVLFLIWPVIYMFISSLFDTTLVRTGLGDFIGFGNYAEMMTPRRLLGGHVAHHPVHDLHHTTAGDAGLRLRRAGQPGAARPVVLPAGLLRAVHPAVGSDRADLELHLLPDHGAVELLPDPARRRGAEPGAGHARPGHDRHRDHDRLVDDRLQLRALPRRSAGHPEGAVRGRGRRRRHPVAADPLDHHPDAQPDHHAGRPAADHRQPEDLRPGVPDDRRRPGHLDPGACWVWSPTPRSPTTGSAPRRPRRCCCSS